jgi:hypothetical protein
MTLAADLIELPKMRAQNERLRADLVLLQQQNQQLKSYNARLSTALVLIRDREGRVCEDYATCKHESCRSSHSSWDIADTALRALEVKR